MLTFIEYFERESTYLDLESNVVVHLLSLKFEHFFHLVLIVFRKKWPLFGVLPDYCVIEVDVRCTKYLVPSIPTLSIWCCTDVPKSLTISWNKIPCSSFYITHQLTFQGLLSASWHKKVNSEVLMNSSFLRAHRRIFGCGFHEESEYSICGSHWSLIQWNNHHWLVMVARADYKGIA